MKRLISFSLSLLFLALNLTIPPFDSAQAAPIGLPITASSAVLLDAATQKFIYAKAPHARRPPASTTKIMTAMVVLEKSSLNQIVRIPKGVGRIEPSKIYIRPGERYTIRDLLHATLISSANDAAEVLAVATAGSRTKFAQWMNERAHRIGCRNTHFMNPSGLPSASQYSTSYDLALIMEKAQKNPFIVDSLSRKYYTVRSLEGRTIGLKNHNRLLWKSERSVIGKTGYTRKGRHCFVGRIKWGGREILISMLGSHRLWKDLKILLDYQFGITLYKVYKNRHHWSETQTKAIQRALVRAGYAPGPLDGKFGPKTVRAVELYQKANGLPSDGIIGIATCRKLTRHGLSPTNCSS